jgi:hypothetical protein
MRVSSSNVSPILRHKTRSANSTHFSVMPSVLNKIKKVMYVVVTTVKVKIGILWWMACIMVDRDLRLRSGNQVNAKRCYVYAGTHGIPTQ